MVEGLPFASGNALFVVATPIGNLEDITLRALETLKKADCIVCEDTRRTLKLLTHYDIRKPLLSIFGPKERRETDKILKLLSEGKNVALVSDAGTPGLSDPGNVVVAAARENKFRIIPVPGACAISSALSASGLAGDGFVFLGFLRRAPGKVRKELKKAAENGLAIVFYESPYRVVKTLELAAEVLGENASCFIGREMTKKFEEFLNGSLKEVASLLEKREILGEFTVVLKQQEKPEENPEENPEKSVNGF